MTRVILAAACASLLLASAQDIRAQRGPEPEPDIFLLGALAASDPASALLRTEAALAGLAASEGADLRVLFDLMVLRAELLRGLGRTAEAADAFSAAARFATRWRDRLGEEPGRLHAEAARLLERTGQPAAARAETRALLELQRDGGLPGEMLAGTMQELARLSDAIGETQTAAQWRDQAGTAPGATRSTEDGYRIVDVYYATDRARTGRGDPGTFYGAGRGDLELGIAEVTIPESHQPGQIEAPSIWRLEFGPSPARHIMLRSVTPLSADDFYDRLQDAFGGGLRRDALVFVHGYNVGFDTATRRAAQLAYDMRYPGVPILYSWPSRGLTSAYLADSAVVRLSGRRLAGFLDELAARSGAGTIHLVAHSMGNRALTDALELLALRHGLQPGDLPLFDQVVFAAPDVDAGLFREMLPTIRPVAKRLTLYASEQDWALVTSRRLHGDAPRAGEGGKDTLVAPQIDSVDMSALGSDMLAHSYFADDQSALADMVMLFWRDIPPARRCGLARQPARGTATAVWLYRRDDCASSDLIRALGHVWQAQPGSAADIEALLARIAPAPEAARQLEALLREFIGHADRPHSSQDSGR